MSPSAKEFYLTIVRHGQTLANVNKEIQGHSNTPLTSLGKEQAKALAKYFYTNGPSQIDQVYSSDLGRAHETCRIILAHMNELTNGQSKPVPIILDERLRERKYGTYFEGKPISMLQAEAFKLGFDSYNFTHYTPPEAETMNQVQKRVSEFCEDVLWKQSKHLNEVLIISHWATIKEFLKLFQPSASGSISSVHLMETPNLAFSRFKICCTTLGTPMSSLIVGGGTQPDDEKQEQFCFGRWASASTESSWQKIDIKVVSLHQTVHLRADQISVSLRQQLC